MTLSNLAKCALPAIILCLAGCGGGSLYPPASKPFTVNYSLSYSLSVNPSSITVVAGSAVDFTAMFAPSSPVGGSLTWSINPANGGTITSSGGYTAPATAGTYTVVATWTPSNAGAGSSISGSAVVEVLPPPQLGAELNPDVTQASGSIQVFGSIQNAAVVGQFVPYVISTESSNAVQVQSGFAIPTM